MRALTVQWALVSALMNRDKRCQQQRLALKDRLHYKGEAHNIPGCFVSDKGNMFPANRFFSKASTDISRNLCEQTIGGRRDRKSSNNHVEI
ncbi:hypothetical protein CEXT_247981 [Caerostris extrusa]|uniref:Secreted protein n=1 Tax=Caerostris extrusa TaxID=172846 RepID=A0AAV4VMS0_CAEEX|nr:hypothetical protein CEXT_247981 [Caerostris extrusa]